MKRMIVLVGVLVLLAGLYIAMPFVTAWRMREAVKAADIAYLADKVEWASVRDSLKTSIKQHAILTEEVNEQGRTVPPTMWQRVKLAFGQPMVDSFVDRYVTPEGLPQLFQLKTSFNETVRGEVPEASRPRLERMARFVKRIRRAEFLSPTALEIELADKRRPDRIFLSRLELKGFEWKLTRVEVRTLPAAAGSREDMAAEPQRLFQGRSDALPLPTR